DPNAAQVLQTALTGFGNSVSTFGGFGGSVAIGGGFNQIQTSALCNLTISGGTNSFAQALDPNAAAGLNTLIGGCGRSVSSLGGFGRSVGTLGGFGGSVAITGGFNAIATSLLTGVNVSGGTTSYAQAIDPNGAQVLDQAIATIQSQFGSSPSIQGGFGA